MRRIVCLPIIMGAMLNLAGCQMASEPNVFEQEVTPECIGANCGVIHYAMPNGNDLILETTNHVIEIAANPDSAYTYYVWSGDKAAMDDPDMIVDQGQVMILTEE